MLKPGRLVAVTEQRPSHTQSVEEVLQSAGANLTALLGNAGFGRLRLEGIALKNGVCICALGVK